MDTLITAAQIGLVIIGALIAVLAVIAPMTKTESDNWVLAKLQALKDAIGKLIGAKPTK